MNAPKKIRVVDFEELYPGRFQRACDFQGKKVTLTIADVALEELEGEDGKEVKATISFEEKSTAEDWVRELSKKELCLNRTNGEAIKAMFGSKVPQWRGKRVTLFPSVVTERGMLKGKPCIRVWGSPDIAHDMDIVIKRPRQDAKSVTLHKVVMGKPAADAPREPGADG